MNVEDGRTLSSSSAVFAAAAASAAAAHDSSQIVLGEHGSDEFQNAKLVIRKSTTDDESTKAALSADGQAGAGDDQQTPGHEHAPQQQSQSDKHVSPADHSNYQLDKPAKLAFEVTAHVFGRQRRQRPALTRAFLVL